MIYLAIVHPNKIQEALNQKNNGVNFTILEAKFNVNIRKENFLPLYYMK